MRVVLGVMECGDMECWDKECELSSVRGERAGGGGIMWWALMLYAYCCSCLIRVGEYSEVIMSSCLPGNIW